MFKFMLQFKTSLSLHIKNRQNLTPLTLAASLARKKVIFIIFLKTFCQISLMFFFRRLFVDLFYFNFKLFDFILEQLREVWFTYGEVSCGSYPLNTIDTISNDGTTDTKSAIYLIANGVFYRRFSNILFCHTILQ